MVTESNVVSQGLSFRAYGHGTDHNHKPLSPSALNYITSYSRESESSLLCSYWASQTGPLYHNQPLGVRVWHIWTTGHWAQQSLRGEIYSITFPFTQTLYQWLSWAVTLNISRIKKLWFICSLGKILNIIRKHGYFMNWLWRYKVKSLHLHCSSSAEYCQN